MRLRPSGDAGLQILAQLVSRELAPRPRCHSGTLRPRADDTHLTAQYVPELRPLVEPGAAQKTPQRTGFGGLGIQPTNVAYMRGLQRKRAKLVDREPLTLLAETYLREEDWPGRSCADGRSDKRAQRRTQNHRKCSKY